MLDFTFPSNFYSEISRYFVMFWLQRMMLPAASPEIRPPSPRSHSAPTDLECYLYTLDANVPFHCTSSPLVIDVITVSPSRAMARLGFRGALPNTPFFFSSFPDANLQKTTSFSHAQMTSS